MYKEKYFSFLMYRTIHIDIRTQLSLDGLNNI